MIMNKLAAWFEIEGGKSNRFASMEGLRGVAILLVFCAHYYDIIWRDLPLHSPTLDTLGKAFLGAGGTGVDLFCGLRDVCRDIAVPSRCRRLIVAIRQSYPWYFRRHTGLSCREHRIHSGHLS